MLVKPFEPEQLVSRVMSLLEHGPSRSAAGAGADGQPRGRVVTPFPGVGAIVGRAGTGDRRGVA